MAETGGSNTAKNCEGFGHFGFASIRVGMIFVLQSKRPERNRKKTGLMLTKNRDWENRLGEGKAVESIIRILKEEFA